MLGIGSRCGLVTNLNQLEDCTNVLVKFEIFNLSTIAKAGPGRAKVFLILRTTPVMLHKLRLSWSLPGGRIGLGRMEACGPWLLAMYQTKIR